MRIVVNTIQHENQRYETVGDWLFNAQGDLNVTISNMNNKKYEFLVAIHEQIEAFLCEDRGISEEAVSAFDIMYENNRPEGDTSEPGDHPKAPYYQEHQFATLIEKMVAHQLGVNWEEYDEIVGSL